MTTSFTCVGASGFKHANNNELALLLQSVLIRTTDCSRLKEAQIEKDAIQENFFLVIVWPGPIINSTKTINLKLGYSARKSLIAIILRPLESLSQSFELLLILGKTAEYPGEFMTTSFTCVGVV